MTITVKELAHELNITQAELLEKFIDAGIAKNSNDIISENDKQELTAFLNKKNEQIKPKLSLKKSNKTNEPIDANKKITLTKAAMAKDSMDGLTEKLGEPLKNSTIKVEIKKKKIILQTLDAVEKLIPIETNIEVQAAPIKARVNDIVEDGNSSRINPRQNSIVLKNDSQQDKTLNSDVHLTPEAPLVKSTPNEIEQKVKLTIDEESDNKKNKLKVVKKTNKMKIIGKTDSSLDDYVDSNEEILPLLIDESTNEDVVHVEHKKIYKEEYKNKPIKIFKVQEFIKPVKSQVFNIAVASTITVSELAHKMAIKASELIKRLMKMNIMATINQAIEQDVAVLLIEEFGHKATLLADNAFEEHINQDNQKHYGDNLISRAPIVTIMGHVDHGKTSLLDYIRNAKVASNEAGGITQHIGAYHVNTKNGMITFLDTPGHEAFSQLRSRGSKLTDIVVLVVASDDGVMPQTIEAINHSKAANVPIIVAINKMDKPNANVDKIKQELSNYGVITEDWGGDVMCVPVSALTGNGVDHLLETILLQAEVLELKATLDAPAKAIVIETKLDKGRGNVVTLLIQNGTLQRGDLIVVGHTYGKIRAMLDENRMLIDSAGPSIPVEILGLSDMPLAGDDVLVVHDERRAREITQFRINKIKNEKMLSEQTVTLENMFVNIDNHNMQTFNIIIKSDAQGSYEAISGSLLRLSTDHIKLQVIHAAIGGINESDVSLASASHAIIVGFNVRADSNAKKLAEKNHIEIRYYDIIYNIIDDVKLAMTGMLSPEKKEIITGNVSIRKLFSFGKLIIAGCMVTDGLIKRNSQIRLIRDNTVIHVGLLSSLKRAKDDAKEVRGGYECGLSIESYSDIKEGDTIEAYEITEVKRTLL